MTMMVMLTMMVMIVIMIVMKGDDDDDCGDIIKFRDDSDEIDRDDDHCDDSDDDHCDDKDDYHLFLSLYFRKIGKKHSSNRRSLSANIQ